MTPDEFLASFDAAVEALTELFEHGEQEPT